MSALPQDAEQNKADTVVEDAPHGADSYQTFVTAPLRSSAS